MSPQVSFFSSFLAFILFSPHVTAISVDGDTIYYTDKLGSVFKKSPTEKDDELLYVGNIYIFFISLLFFVL